MLNRRCKKQQQQQKLLTIKSLWPIIKITRTTRTNEVLDLISLKLVIVTAFFLYENKINLWTKGYA